MSIEKATLDEPRGIRPPSIPRIAYEIVKDVDAYEHLIVNRAVSLAVEELRIQKPKVFFVQQTIRSLADLPPSEAFDGRCKWGGREIYLRCGLEQRLLAKVAFHESRHAQQLQQKRCIN